MIENQEFQVRLPDDVDTPVNPLPREGMFAEGNMENISATIPPCLRSFKMFLPGHMRRY